MARRKTSKQTTTTQTGTAPEERRSYVQSPVVPEPAICCPHCGTEAHDHRVSHTYPNGNRRRICSGCALPFITRRAVEG